jgi:hypothetical protein
MHDSDAQSLIFFVFILIFFIAPPLLKLLGKYTLNSKKTMPASDEIHPEELSDQEPLDERQVDPHDAGPQITNEPIEPRWF